VVVVRVGSKTVHVADDDVLPWRDSASEGWDPPDNLARVTGDRIARLGDIIITTEAIATSTAVIAANTIGLVIGHASAVERIIRVDGGETTRVSAHQIRVYHPVISDIIHDDQRTAAWRLNEQGKENGEDYEA